MSDTEKTKDKINFVYVNIIQCSGAKEVPGFVPTRHELVHLVEHWAGVRLGTIFKVFQTGVIGSSDISQVSFAEERIRSIELLLGEEEVNRVIAQVASEYEEWVDKRDWEIFLHGEDIQREASVLEFRQRHTEVDNKEIDLII
ncbi:MAG: hypothetical protein IH857_07470 [Deltaproteobacteria bacterium]|nr:hypothetical protein [Deltaproteobacteria bacterium]